MEISFILNGNPVTVDVPRQMTLLKVLRQELGLTGAKPGCEMGTCGTCTVIIDDKAVSACTVAMVKVNGRSVITIEGISAPDGTPNDLQKAFLAHGAVQCGYCTPGMVLAGEALLRRNPTPTRMEIRQAIAGNLCRCTGYVQIIDAIEATAQQRQKAQVMA